MALKRINLNLDEEILNQLDTYAKSMHITRSAGISVLLSQFFQGQANFSTLNSFLNVYNEEKLKEDKKKAKKNK